MTRTNREMVLLISGGPIHKVVQSLGCLGFAALKINTFLLGFISLANASFWSNTNVGSKLSESVKSVHEKADMIENIVQIVEPVWLFLLKPVHAIVNDCQELCQMMIADYETLKFFTVTPWPQMFRPIREGYI